MKTKVYLLGHSLPVNGNKPESIPAAAGKLCYSKVGIEELLEKQDDESIKKYLDMLSSSGHESPIEHISFTFGIEDVSRTTEIQLIRHRLASFSIQSGRYVNRNKLNYQIPPAIEENKEAKEIFVEAMEKLEKSYNEITQILIAKYAKEYYHEKDNLKNEEYIEMLKEDKKAFSSIEKMAIEDARYLHPLALKTKIIVTMNARELLHFFNQRCCNRAQWEIRDVADQMLDICLDLAPNIFKKAGASCTFGKCKEGAMSCGKKRHPRKGQINE